MPDSLALLLIGATGLAFIFGLVALIDRAGHQSHRKWQAEEAPSRVQRWNEKTGRWEPAP